MRKIYKNAKTIIGIVLMTISVVLLTRIALARVSFIGTSVTFSDTPINPPVEFKCPEGQTMIDGVCIKQCDRTEFPLTGGPAEEDNKGNFKT